MTYRRNLLVGFAVTSLIAFGTVGCSSDEQGLSANTLPTLPTDGKAAPGRRYATEFGTHCGVERLSLTVNGVSNWITDEATGASTDWIPAEWAEAVDGGLIPVEIVVSAGGTELMAQASGRTVTYRPVFPSDSNKFCE